MLFDAQDDVDERKDLELHLTQALDAPSKKNYPEPERDTRPIGATSTATLRTQAKRLLGGQKGKKCMQW